VAVGAHKAVGIGYRQTIRLTYLHHLSQILQIHLMHDPRSRRHDSEVLEGLLSPAQELVAFAVALEFPLSVVSQRILGSVGINLHRVIYDQIGRHQRVDPSRIGPQPLHCRP